MVSISQWERGLGGKVGSESCQQPIHNHVLIFMLEIYAWGICPIVCVSGRSEDRSYQSLHVLLDDVCVSNPHNSNYVLLAYIGMYIISR